MKFRSEFFGPSAVHDWIFDNGPMPNTEDITEAVGQMIETWGRHETRFPYRRVAADWFRKLADAIERENKQAAEQVAREAA